MFLIHTNDPQKLLKEFSCVTVSQVVFIHDYFQIIMQECRFTVYGVATIEKDGARYEIPSQEGNWLLFSLIEKDALDVNDDEKYITIKFQDNIVITIDKAKSPTGDNFAMGGDGLVPIIM